MVCASAQPTRLFGGKRLLQCPTPKDLRAADRCVVRPLSHARQERGAGTLANSRETVAAGSTTASVVEFFVLLDPLEIALAHPRKRRALTRAVAERTTMRNPAAATGVTDR